MQLNYKIVEYLKNIKLYKNVENKCRNNILYNNKMLYLLMEFLDDSPEDYILKTITELKYRLENAFHRHLDHAYFIKILHTSLLELNAHGMYKICLCSSRLYITKKDHVNSIYNN